MIQILSLFGTITCIRYLMYAYKYYMELHASYLSPNKPDYSRERMGLVMAMLLCLMMILFNIAMFLVDFNNLKDMQNIITYAQMINLLSIVRMFVGLSFYHTANDGGDNK